MIFRIFIGLPLVIFLPGYSLVGLLFPKKDDLSGIERISLSFILNFAIVPLLSLILNFTPFGIRLEPVLIVLSAFTIWISILAWSRWIKLPDEERFRVPFKRLLKVNLGQNVLDKGLYIVLIASIIGSSATLAYVAVKPKPSERFTEFYLLGTNGIASDYPTDLKFEEEGTVIIFIVNHEYENIAYLLKISFNDSLIHEELIFLDENEKMEISFTFKATKKGENQKIDFLLYKDQHIEAYRKLHLWVRIT